MQSLLEPLGEPVPHGLARQLEAVDWTRAWLAPLSVRSRQWQRTLQQGEPAWRAALDAQAAAMRLTLAAGTVAEPGTAPALATPLPLRFVSQAELPNGAAYEAHIATSGAVPTRANLHDFFNAAIWFAFPLIKAALNLRQAGQIARDGIQARRGSVRDALTLFDENAVLFACADPALAQALREFDWETLLQVRRGDWGRWCEACVFGHALLEKLVTPYKAITAHAWIVEVTPAYFGWPPAQRRAHLDRLVARQVATWATPRAFTPLPVLGIPGWWAANAEPAFYADPQVFRCRPRRRRVA